MSNNTLIVVARTGYALCGALVAGILLLFLFGGEMSFSSITWMLLFFFPIGFIGSEYFFGRIGWIVKKEKTKEDFLYDVIFGYAVYSILSLIIMILGFREAPFVWVGVFIVVTVLTLTSKQIKE